MSEPTQPTDAKWEVVEGPEYLGLSIEEWRKSPERVSWLRGVLSSEYGRELVGIIRSSGPAGALPGGWGTGPLVDGAQKMSGNSELLLGMVAGYEKGRKLLTEVLTSHGTIGQPSKRPGERMNP